MQRQGHHAHLIPHLLMPTLPSSTTQLETIMPSAPHTPADVDRSPRELTQGVHSREKVICAQTLYGGQHEGVLREGLGGRGGVGG